MESSNCELVPRSFYNWKTLGPFHEKIDPLDHSRFPMWCCDKPHQ